MPFELRSMLTRCWRGFHAICTRAEAGESSLRLFYLTSVIDGSRTPHQSSSPRVAEIALAVHIDGSRNNHRFD